MAKRHEALIPLSHDHQKALMLAFRLTHPAPPGPVTPTTPVSTPQSRREEVLSFFEQHLLEHFAIEEEILFPVLRAAAPGAGAAAELIDALCDDHVRMKAARDRIEHTVERADLEAELQEFGRLLEAHVRREEREMFTDFPGSLAAEEVQALHERIHSRRPPDRPRRGS